MAAARWLPTAATGVAHAACGVVVAGGERAGGRDAMSLVGYSIRVPPRVWEGSHWLQRRGRCGGRGAGACQVLLLPPRCMRHTPTTTRSLQPLPLSPARTCTQFGPSFPPEGPLDFRMRGISHCT